jgi:glutamate N-acetyltransferase/amino-acid N-acetyltransferase
MNSVRAMASARTFTTSTTLLAKSTPSKVHHFVPIPDTSFPQGYLATGIHCGVKKKPGVLDLALITSTSRRTSSAACFTKNVFKAAPVQVSRKVLQLTSGRAKALVVNSGCANAVTGKQGMEDAWEMVHAASALVEQDSGENHPGKEALVMSTGVIGQTLPIQRVLSGIASAKSSLSSGFDAWVAAARAFMTTDTFPKLRARTFKLDGVEVRIAGIDKGAGMIHPNMGPPHATLLGLIATDAAIGPRSLQNALTYAVERSFNSISVDGDMSTNDTIIAFANGASGMKAEIEEETHPEAYATFRNELTSFAIELAQLVVRDGEGATKFVTVSVEVRSHLV